MKPWWGSSLLILVHRHPRASPDPLLSLPLLWYRRRSYHKGIIIKMFQEVCGEWGERTDGEERKFWSGMTSRRMWKMWSWCSRSIVGVGDSRKRAKQAVRKRGAFQKYNSADLALVVLCVKFSCLQQWIRPAEFLHPHFHIYIYIYVCEHIYTYMHTRGHKCFYVFLACVIEKMLQSVFASTLCALCSTRPLLPQCLGEISQLMMSNRLLVWLFIW